MDTLAVVGYSIKGGRFALRRGFGMKKAMLVIALFLAASSAFGFSLPDMRIPDFKIRRKPLPKVSVGESRGRGFARKTPQIPKCGGRYFEHLPKKHRECSWKGEWCHQRTHNQCECYRVCRRCGMRID